MLTLYNSLTRQKQVFTPIIPNQVRMYVCGMTVYDYCHLGHARVLVVFDMVSRYLRALGYTVHYVRNITDIDDKIIARAAANQESVTALTERFIQAMHEDAAALGVLPPSHEPRATQAIPEMQAMIESLINQGYAYRSEPGEVLYAVNRFADYGKLANKQLDQLRSGARVEVDDNKQEAADFVLWKPAKADEPAWESPWGQGRPGWHIECSAMSTQCLGPTLDIHGGGMDLKFPHHENEIAQSEAATGKKFVNYWMHNGFVTIDDEKMSKSLGNFFTVRDILAQYRAESLRFLLLGSHYRSPLSYSNQQLQEADTALTRLYTSLRAVSALSATAPTPLAEAEMAQQQFFKAMDDDFNTPEAIAVLFDLTSQINRLLPAQPEAAGVLGAKLKQLGGILGLLQADPAQFLQQAAPATNGLTHAEIEQLIQERKNARSAKNFAEADRIRSQLTQAGIVLEDTASGTLWRRS